MSKIAAVILAAGKSTRMKSALPKVLHSVCGRPMIEYVLDAARQAGASRLVVVVGHRAEDVRATLAHHRDVEFALQAEQLGTGHAVMMCREALREHHGPVLILAGDTPLLQASSLERLLSVQQTQTAACVIGSAITPANQGLGRVVRDAAGRFQRIVEEKDATPEQRAIQEINTGCYAFDAQALLRALERIQPNNVQKEYYLTDCPRVLLDAGQTVVAEAAFTTVEALGVNTRVQLAEVTASIQQTVQERLMVNGVTIVSPAQTFIDPRAEIGPDTVIEPFVSILGPVKIGADCHLESHVAVQGPREIPAGTRVAAMQRLGPTN